MLMDDHDKLEQKSKEYLQEIVTLKSDNERLVLTLNRYLKELKDRNEEIENLKVHISYDKQYAKKQLEMASLREENKQIAVLSKNLKRVRNRLKRQNNRVIPDLENENQALRTSASYRIGQVFVNAVTKPGKNTILFPYYFLRVIFESIFVRKLN